MLFLDLLSGLLMLSLDLFDSCIKSTWYDVFQDVLLKRFTLSFSRVYNDIKGTSKRDEYIMILCVFPRRVRATDLPQLGGRSKILYPLLITWWLMLWYGLSLDIVLYMPILNQFCPLLLTSTLISLGLISSELLLLLETFNKEDIFICGLCWLKNFLYPVTRHKKPYIHAHNFFVSFFCLHQGTSPTTLMNAKQYALIPLLFLLSRLCVFDSHCVT